MQELVEKNKYFTIHYQHEQQQYRLAIFKVSLRQYEKICEKIFLIDDLSDENLETLNMTAQLISNMKMSFKNRLLYKLTGDIKYLQSQKLNTVTFKLYSASLINLLLIINRKLLKMISLVEDE